MVGVVLKLEHSYQMVDVNLSPLKTGCQRDRGPIWHRCYHGQDY